MKRFDIQINLTKIKLYDSISNSKGRCIMKTKRKKTVCILCSKSEYNFVLNHLNEIIDIEKEKPLFPYEFFYYKIEDKKIIEKKLIEAINDELKQLFYKRWYFKKLQHFKNIAEWADQIAIVKSDIPTDLDDLAEKKEEIDYAIKIKKKPLRIIKSENLTYQKIR